VESCASRVRDASAHDGQSYIARENFAGQ